MKIKLYIEGGGDSQLQDTQFRAGWATFFEKAGFKGQMPATFRGGGREQTFDAYCTAVKKRKPDELPLLLVDSEDLPHQDHTAWQHLACRTADGWTKPNGAGDEDAFLMICCMETWFLADRDNLKQHFGHCWRDNALPQWPNLEAVAKPAIFQALAKATADCEKKSYAKGRLSFELLKVIDPAKVAATCPSAKALLDRLKKP